MAVKKIIKKPVYNSDVFSKKLIENMNEAVWVGDKDERTIYANPKFCKIIEYSLEEILGRESYDFWDKESAKTVKSVNEHHRKKGISSSYEGNLLTKSGKKVPVYLSGTPLPDGGTIGIMTDLTELKWRTSLYKKLIENMNEAVWMGDKDERTIYANPKFCKIIEYSLEEILGRESYDFWDKESSKVVRKVNKTKRKQGLTSSYEGNLLTKSGRKIPVYLSGTSLPDGGTIGIMTDLTELKKKERMEKILNSAVQHATDAIIIFDKNFKILSWNKGAKMIFGYKKEEMLGEHLQKLFLRKQFDLFLKSKKNISKFDFWTKAKNKQPIYLSMTLTPIIEEGEQKRSFSLLIARDITSKVKFEEELTAKYHKIQEAYNKFGLIKRQMDYIFEALALFDQPYDKKTIADFIVSSIIMLTKADHCVLRVYNSNKDVLELISCFGGIYDWRSKGIIRFQNSLAQKAFEQNTSLKIIDIFSEPKYQSGFLARKNNLSSLLLIPLTFKGKPIGTLSLYTCADKKLEIFENAFVEQYAKLLQVLVGVIFQNG